METIRSLEAGIPVTAPRLLTARIAYHRSAPAGTVNVAAEMDATVTLFQSIGANSRNDHFGDQPAAPYMTHDRTPSR
jgi:hypothetical protein